jgi:hypothetical protein
MLNVAVQVFLMVRPAIKRSANGETFQHQQEQRLSSDAGGSPHEETSRKQFPRLGSWASLLPHVNDKCRLEMSTGIKEPVKELWMTTAIGAPLTLLYFCA